MSSQGFLDAAHRIGRTLCRDAVWSGPACNWIGWTARPIGGRLIVGRGSQTAGLGYGTAGIGLFLARLYALTSDALVGTTSRAALRHAADNAALSDSGLFTGYTGIVCAMAEAGELLGAGEHQVQACRLLGKAIETPAGAATRNGNAALQYATSIPALVAVSRNHQLQCAIELAVHAGDKVVEMFSAGEDRIVPPAAAMIANALAELAAATGLEGFKAACGVALQAAAGGAPAAAYWPDETQYGFPDLYNEVAAPLSFLYAHVLRAARLHPDSADLAQHARAVMESTYASLTRPLAPGDGGYCLAHGAAGKAEVLMLAAHLQGRGNLLPVAAEAGRTGVTCFSEKRMPWPCALPAGESPNLMWGLAGIGYFYLRLCDPANVPSLLV